MLTSGMKFDVVKRLTGLSEEDLRGLITTQ
jgi:hypothetical protein